ncbi:hypothetical protein GCM10023317_37910 [Actinopolymorpha pittospori]
MLVTAASTSTTSQDYDALLTPPIPRLVDVYGHADETACWNLRKMELHQRGLVVTVGPGRVGVNAPHGVSHRNLNLR